jgi:hypothetical protein
MTRLVAPALVFAALSLAACETPQPMAYQPVAGPQAVGFSEQRIEPGRYRIFFHGAPGAPRAMVEDYALRRAADLALSEGFDWFRVYDRNLAYSPSNGPHVGLSIGGVSFGHNSAVAASVGQGFDLGGGPSVTAILEVTMGRGPKPPSPDAYDARGVREAIRTGA